MPTPARASCRRNPAIRSSLERLEDRRLLTTYSVTDLGVTPVDLNDSAQIVGVANGRAALWQAGAVTDLGTLGGPASAAGGINNVGTVVGSAAADATSPATAFRWRDGVMTNLGLGNDSSAVAVNDAGQIAANAGGRALLWDEGATTDLGSLGPGGAEAADVNRAGQVTGASWAGGYDGAIGLPSVHAFVWQAGVMTDLGTPAFTMSSYPRAINNAGQVVGSSTYYVNTGYGAAVVSRSFFYDGQSMQVLPVPGLQSWASDINDAGQIVGFAGGHAFVFQDGVYTDLNTVVTPGQPVLTAAVAINNAGQIVASNIAGRAVLLTPVAPARGPEVEAWVGATEITDGSGSVKFGDATVGDAVSRTLVVRNVGDVPLELAGPVTLPAGFMLASGFSATTVAPGATATFVVRLDTSATGSFGGVVSFGTNDADEGTFDFTVSGTVDSGRVIDDGAPGFATTGIRPTVLAGQGYQGDVRRLFAPDARLTSARRFMAPFNSTATWTFGNVAAGTYRVSATWTAGPDRTAAAPFVVSNNAALLTALVVNQRQAPRAFTARGVAWDDLGTFTVTAGTVTVRTTNRTLGRVIADAVRIERVAGAAAMSPAAPPVPAAISAPAVAAPALAPVRPLLLSDNSPLLL
jgi:probable HAF family extracellular repeat protein